MLVNLFFLHFLFANDIRIFDGFTTYIGLLYNIYERNCNINLLKTAGYVPEFNIMANLKREQLVLVYDITLAHISLLLNQ